MLRSRLLNITGVLYAVFAFSLCWIAYAKAAVPIFVTSTNGQPLSFQTSPLFLPQQQQLASSPPNVSQAANALTLQQNLEVQMAKLELDRKELEVQQQYLENRSKEIDKRADDLEHLISEMTIGSGGYTLLLGLFAFFGLKAAGGEADRYLGILKDQVTTFKTDTQADRDKAKEEAKAEREIRSHEYEKFKADIRDDIPSLYGMQRALGILLERIRRQVDMSQIWTFSEAYKKMTEDQRQKLVLAEMTVASFDYFRLDSSVNQRKVAAQIFSDLANFYSARARINPAKYESSDIRRALIYIERANQMDPSNARLLSQRSALILTNVAKEGDKVTQDQLDEAEFDLRECLKLNPNDIRGLYNLAWVAEERQNFTETATLLKQIVDQRVSMPPDERGRRLISAFVNLACVQAKIVKGTSDTNEREKIGSEIFQNCRAAYEEATISSEVEYAKNSFKRELSPGGDMYSLLTTLPEIAASIEELS